MSELQMTWMTMTWMARDLMNYLHYNEAVGGCGISIPWAKKLEDSHFIHAYCI